LLERIAGSISATWSTSMMDASARDHENRPLVKHNAEWQADLVSQGHTVRHADHTSNRVRRLIAIMTGSPAALLDHRRVAPDHRGDVAKQIAAAFATARLSDLAQTRVQNAIGKIRDAGWSLQTANHYRAAIRAFSAWCYENHRTREDGLRGLAPYNAKKDRRHDHRTVSLEELHKLIAVAQAGPEVMGMTGEARAFCYRLAVASGLRYAEIGSVTPQAFDWEAPSVTVAAAYTKNGEPQLCPCPTTWRTN
jgi:integrase